MKSETAKITLQFLARVQLTGNEVPAFNQVIAELSEIVNTPEKAE